MRGDLLTKEEDQIVADLIREIQSEQVLRPGEAPAFDDHTIWTLCARLAARYDAGLADRVGQIYCYHCPTCGCWVLPDAAGRHGRLHNP